MRKLAIEGGRPVRQVPLHYGRQSIEQQDVDAVVRTLNSEYLTTGPAVANFEHAIAEATGTKHAVAMTNGTAALHAMYAAGGIRAGHEVVVPALTFAATGNAALHLGARPAIADVDAGTLCMTAATAKAAISGRTRAIVAVDFAGQPSDMQELQEVADDAGVPLWLDAAHSLGGTYMGQPVGGHAEMSSFSFHPVKGITTGEGGMVVTNSDRLAARLRRFRNHGIDADSGQREKRGIHAYSMVDLGHNFRLSDIHAALGSSQLHRLKIFVERRSKLAERYGAELASIPGVNPLAIAPDRSHAWHLYVVRLDSRLDRDLAFEAMRAENIFVNVHYPPLHKHPYYERNNIKPTRGTPVADTAYEQMLSLPLHPGMTIADQNDVITALASVLTSDYVKR